MKCAFEQSTTVMRCCGCPYTHFCPAAQAIAPPMRPWGEPVVPVVPWGKPPEPVIVWWSDNAGGQPNGHR